MTPAERGFLLLASRLGSPDRRVLTTAQLRTLAVRLEGRGMPEEERELLPRDLQCLGYDQDTARRIISLLEEEELLDHYLSRAAKAGCTPITRANPAYPLALRKRLGLDSPGCLWAKGDLSILNTPMVSLVGSRDLREPNREFAAELGYQAAMQGWTLVSGNARGADRTAQEACLKAGGRVISIVADELSRQIPGRNLLYLSEENFDDPFSTPRALSRNRCIHALGNVTFVAQSTLGKGGTWDGTVKNLRYGWSSVAVFRDGSEASRQLEDMGAALIPKAALQNLDAQLTGQTSLFDTI